MKRLVLAVVLVTLLVVPVAVACASATPATQQQLAPSFSGLPESDYKDEGSGALTVTDERMIVRTGDLSMVMADVIGTRDSISQLAVSYGGYVVSSQISGEEDKTGYVSLRVPDERFEAALAELKELAIRVTSESTVSRDVTEEYVDLESRLKNAEATESQYLTLLQQTEFIEEILDIYERLSQIRYEIEHIKGQMQYLERTASMSLISVYLSPQTTAQPLVPAGWDIAEVFKSAIRGLATVGQVLGSVVVWLLILSPIWGTALGIVIWRIRKRRKARPTE